MTEQLQQQLEQKAILVGVNLNHQADFDYSMEELANLTEACDIEVVGVLTQNLPKVTPSHYIGTGKIEEVRALLEAHGGNLVIFNDELSPSQLRNLESDLQCKVIDRTLLILDIFAERAKTREAQLQVEVARLKYMLPRLVGLRESLGRQSGGVGTKTAARGNEAGARPAGDRGEDHRAQPRAGDAGRPPPNPAQAAQEERRARRLARRVYQCGEIDDHERAARDV
ncbi:hypothetical protein HMSSN139_19170 [Paenibacillus sp. HMSSN-139]|nr:hypothetical protein HMSSN139_19170 [Paenibacillus sp. HMSSN-139]